jgi:peptidoglycan/LPS O-acetylase OafA/YrhL
MRTALMFSDFSLHRWLSSRIRYPLGEGHELREPLWKLTGQTKLGGLSVHCFFIISGFLIAASWDQRKDVGQFLKKRVLRIYPGFIVANAVGVFLVAPMAADSAIGNAGVSLQQFAFPIQQLLVMNNAGSMHPYVLFALALPLSILAGILSWYFVERPFLRRARSAQPKQPTGSYELVAQQPSALV